MTRSETGLIVDGAPVESVVLEAPCGVRVELLSLGATLQRFFTADTEGRLADIVLGHDDVRAYLEDRGFLGVTIGRYANRIGGARFSLDGVEHRLVANNGANTLHGGERGWDQRNWRIVEASGDAVTFALHSPDGDEGFPGAVDATTRYRLAEDGTLEIAFEARTDRPTVVAMTNHALFHLGGGQASGAAVDHELTIPASRYARVDAQQIPLPGLAPVEGTVFDFRQARRISDGLRDGREEQIRIGRGYDHNFATDDAAAEGPRLVARLSDPISGRVLEVLSTEPGVQLYTGNFLHGDRPGKGARLYRMGDGVALEPQKFPDTPNRPDFPSARLDPGEVYRHVMVYRPSPTG